MIARSCLLVFQAVLLTTVFLIPSEAATILVPSQQPTIQDGISAAAAGDTVLIAPGIHLGAGNRDISFLGKDVVVMSELGSESTTVDCEALGRGFLLMDGESATAELRGLTIVNGSALFGAGVFCVGSSPTIVDCVFRDNVATEAGGGLCCVWSDAVLDSCRFIDNTARDEIASGDGGGVYCENSNLTLTACSFISNFVGGYGGGLYSHGARVDLHDCLFQANGSSDGQGGGMANFASSTGSTWACTFMGNTAPDGGGVVFHESSRTFWSCRFKDNWAEGAFGCRGGAVHGGSGSSLSFHDCLFDGNGASDLEDQGDGGAVSIEQSGSVLIDGCTLYNNTASTGLFGVGRGGGLFVGWLAHAVLENTIIAASNDAEAVYCSVESTVDLRCCDLHGNDGGDWVGCIAGLYGVEGNISAGPFFCDPGNGDFSLADFSPCAPDQSPGECGLIGAYGVACASPVAVADPHHAAIGPSRIWNYPNPFNPSTTIVYELSNPSRVTLKIFDVSGRAVRSLIDGSPTDSGQYRMRWDGTDGSGRRVESGVYFGHLEIGTDQQRRTMVLVK